MPETMNNMLGEIQEQQITVQKKSVGLHGKTVAPAGGKQQNEISAQANPLLSVPFFVTDHSLCGFRTSLLLKYPVLNHSEEVNLTELQFVGLRHQNDKSYKMHCYTV